MNDATIKRIVNIGAELVALDKQRNEIDTKTKTLISEAHRLTRPKGLVTEDGEPVASLPKIIGTGQLVRNGEPTLRSRVLAELGKGAPVSKYTLSQTLGIQAMQAHYCLTTLLQKKLVERIAQGTYVLSERGKGLTQPVLTVEGSPTA